MITQQKISYDGDHGMETNYFSFTALCLVDDVSLVSAFNVELCNNLKVVYFCRGRNLVPFSKKFCITTSYLRALSANTQN
jgi:hypothetical protein